MTPRTAQSPTVPPPVLRGRVQWWWPLLPLGVIAFVFVVAQLTRTSPPSVPRITIVNNSVYDVDVAVTGTPLDGWMGLGTAQAHNTTTVVNVIDQAPTWIFRFTGQRQDGGELQISRTDLAHNRWTITIPQRVQQRPHNAGAPPSPTNPHSCHPDDRPVRLCSRGAALPEPAR